MTERKPTPHFSQPVGQITTMLIVLGLVGGGLYLGRGPILAIFWSNPVLNGLITGVFILGVLLCFRQVVQLMYSVQWIEGFAAERTGHHLTKAPSLLAPLATLLRSRGARTQLSSSSGRSILESVGQRIDEVREITRYIGNTLIFLGLLGTFYGLATTVPALVETIRSLSPEDGQGADVFNRLQAGLESQLGGMGTAFSSSLLGLAGSLVVGLLELFVTQGQNRFFRELEEWLSTITRISIAGAEDGDTSGGGEFIEHLAEQIENMTVMFAQSDASRSELDEKLGKLAVAMETMAYGQNQSQGDSGQAALLTRIAEGQERLIKKLEEGGVDGLDAESRMRLRSIDVQLLRVLEEMSAGRQETMSEIRSDIAGLSRTLKSIGGGTPNGY